MEQDDERIKFMERSSFQTLNQDSAFRKGNLSELFGILPRKMSGQEMKDMLRRECHKEKELNLR